MGLLLLLCIINYFITILLLKCNTIFSKENNNIPPLSLVLLPLLMLELVLLLSVLPASLSPLELLLLLMPQRQAAPHCLTACTARRLRGQGPSAASRAVVAAARFLRRSTAHRRSSVVRSTAKPACRSACARRPPSCRSGRCRSRPIRRRFWPCWCN